MIRHIVLFSAIPGKQEQLGRGLKKLEVLKDLGLCDHIEIGKNLKIDQQDNRCDVVVYAEFSSTHQLSKFQEHIIYQKCIEVVRPNRDIRMPVDFESA
jgi:hypothetical protein